MHKEYQKYLDQGISVLICPEGKVSANGVTGAIAPSIARLVQWLGYPVGVIKMQGASLARPKWAYNLRFVRRGRVVTNCDMLFTKEEAKSLSKEEIYQKSATRSIKTSISGRLKTALFSKVVAMRKGLTDFCIVAPSAAVSLK